MRRVIAALLFLAAAAALPAAAQTGSGNVIEVNVPAPSLAGNLLGDPTEQRAAIYLPPGYEKSSRRYAVIYLLHGIGDSYDVWLEHFEVPKILDALIQSGDIEPLIMVMPNGRNRYGGSFYADSPVTGRWQSFIAEDLVRWVDSHYRTRANSQSRAIAGHSMGGFGAITLGMHRPETFSVVYAMSPCCLAAVEDIGYGNPSWHRAIAAADVNELFTRAREGEFYPLAIVALLAAFAPNAGKPPLFVEFPFASSRGELVPTEPAYTRFLDRFPIAQVDDFRERLRKLTALRIDYGIDDQFAHIPVGSREFSQELSEHRVPHELSSYAGDHRKNLSARLRTVVFPYLATHLSFR